MGMAELVVAAVVFEGRSKSAVARDYGISRRWVCATSSFIETAFCLSRLCYSTHPQAQAVQIIYPQLR